jgi:hypothetical protein
MHTHFCWGNLKERDCLKNLRGGWEDNIKMGVKVMGWGCVDWISLVQDRQECRGPVNTVINIQVA